MCILILSGFIVPCRWGSKHHHEMASQLKFLITKGETKRNDNSNTMLNCTKCYCTMLWCRVPEVLHTSLARGLEDNKSSADYNADAFWVECQPINHNEVILAKTMRNIHN